MDNGWLNTAAEIRPSRPAPGKVSAPRFLDLCCINCMHVPPRTSRFSKKKYDDDNWWSIGSTRRNSPMKKTAKKSAGPTPYA